MKITWTIEEIEKMQAAVDAAGISVDEAVGRICPISVNRSCGTCDEHYGIKSRCRVCNAEHNGWRPIQ